MNVLAATDLDRTLIYSSKASKLGSERPPVVCVEMHDGKQAAFMTAVAAGAAAELADIATLMPVTTRITDQLARVTLPGRKPRFAVAANGGVLIADGGRDPIWDKHVAERLREVSPLSEVWEHVAHVCRPEWTSKLRNAEGLFCYAVIDRRAMPSGFLDDVTGWAEQRGWSTSMQGRKLYWVPKTLTKSAAVAEVAERIGADVILAAGDSLLDIDLLVFATLGIHPRHGELFDSGWSHPGVLQTAHTGVRAGQEILEWFLSMARAGERA